MINQEKHQNIHTLRGLVKPQRLPHSPVLVDAMISAPFTLVARKTLATREADASLPDANATMRLPHGNSYGNSYGHTATQQMNCK